MREEVFAADDPPASRVPYTVSQHRYLLRLLQPSASMLVLPLESQVYRYEREPADPACQHTINLRRDRYGCLVHGLTIDYARRKQASDTPPVQRAPSADMVARHPRPGPAGVLHQ